MGCGYGQGSAMWERGGGTQTTTHHKFFSADTTLALHVKKPTIAYNSVHIGHENVVAPSAVSYICGVVGRPDKRGTGMGKALLFWERGGGKEPSCGDVGPPSAYKAW